MSGSLVAVEIMILIAVALALVRIARGPSLPDRVVALDLLATLMVGFLATRVLATGRSELLDIAIVLGLVAFLATVCFGSFIERSADEGEEEPR